jgi:hypothetical protein
MKKFHFLKHLFKEGLFLGMLCCSSLGMAQTPTQIYDSGSNIGSPVASTVGTVTAAPKSTSDLKSGSLSWAGAPSVSGYFQAGSSSNNIQLTFNGGGLPVSSCGSNKGNITVIWGHTSKGKALTLELNGSAVTGTNTTATAANTVYTAEFPIASSITTINTINLKSSGSSGLVIFSVQVNSCNNSPTLTLTPTSLTGFTCAEGMCPSTEKSFTVEGVNLTAGNISINAPTGYEISTTSGSGFGSTTSITAAAGTLAAKTVYVRIAGTATQSASLAGDITINGSTVGVTTAQKVGVTGIVTAAPVFTITPNPIPTLSYIEGQGPSTVQTLYVSGTNLPAGDIKIAPMNIFLSTSATGTFASSGITVVSNFAGGTLPATAFYVQLPAGLPQGTGTGGVTPWISDAGGSANIFSGGIIYINTEVLPVPTTPTLSVSPTSITGLGYVFGSTTSVAKSFDISGMLLTATPITIDATGTDFEVSLTQGSGYANLVQIPSASFVGGTLSNTNVYVRLATGKAINASYTGNITVSGGGASLQTVAASAAVTPAPLTPPTVGTPSNPSQYGFTANWSAVANATGYIVNVYRGAVIETFVAVSGQATISAVVSGLSPATTYTYKVIAVGNGTTNSNSIESAASSSVATLSVPPPPSTSACEIPLYQTDFTDWENIVEDDAKNVDYKIGQGGGAGFIIDKGSKPTHTLGNAKLCFANSTNGITFKPMTFISGGVVEIVANVNKNSKTLTMSGATFTNGTIDSQPAIGTNPSSITANTFTSGKDYGKYTMTFTFTGSGPLTLKLSSDAKCGEIDIVSIKVCTSIGSTPYVACTNYPRVPADGYTMSAVLGGGAESGTPVNDVPIVKAWNTTSDIKLTVEGTDAAKFSFTGVAADGSLTIPNVTAINGAYAPITFTPSVREGISSATLKVEAPGCATCQPYYVNLTGITGDITPKIIADTTTIYFWTSVIKPVTYDVDIAGVNLTTPVSLNLTGSSRFTFTPTSISKSEALTGTKLTITFTGDITSGTLNGILNLTSGTADPVVIKLVGITLDKKPVLYNLDFAVDPAGTAYVNTYPAGKVFLEGTQVKVTVTPETNWKVKGWSDISGNKNVARTITVGQLKNTNNGFPITVYMEAGQQGVVVTPTGGLVAYDVSSITDVSFTASWSTPAEAIPGTTVYTITIYDDGGNVIQTQTSTGNSLVVTGLNPSTFYSYAVSTTVPDGSSGTKNYNSEIIGPLKTSGIVPFTCGDQP